MIAIDASDTWERAFKNNELRIVFERLYAKRKDYFMELE
jgi:hypothetical protein